MQEAEYRKLASVEDSHWYFRNLHRLVEGALEREGPGPLRILDAGCGTGGLIRRSGSEVGSAGRKHPNWSWTGIDLSPLAAALARERVHFGQGEPPAIVEGSLETLPFGDGAFSAAVCADVLYHLDDDEKALRELRRVLLPGSPLILNVPAHPWLWSYHDEAVAGRRRYTAEALTRKLRTAGFAVERITHWNTVLFPLIVIRRKLLPAPRSGSDVGEPSAIGDAAGAAATALERLWLAAGGRLPFGSSLFAVARAPRLRESG